MAVEIPEPGQVFEYYYLWHWQEQRGETEGRKSRPCCVVVVATNAKGQHVLFIAPITSKPPRKGRIGVPIPETEARRARLDTIMPLWIMVDELSVDILEASYVLENRTPLGQFSAAFTNMVIRRTDEVRQTRKISLSRRT